MTDETDAPTTASQGQSPQSAEPPDGLQAVKKAADFALGEALDALREVAREKTGGRLTFSAIKFQFEAFIAEPNHDMITAYENAWRACTQTAKAAAWQKERTFPLERLVVRRFEHLFPPRGTARRISVAADHRTVHVRPAVALGSGAASAIRNLMPRTGRRPAQATWRKLLLGHNILHDIILYIDANIKLYSYIYCKK